VNHYLPNYYCLEFEREREVRTTTTTTTIAESDPFMFVFFTTERERERESCNKSGTHIRSVAGGPPTENQNHLERAVKSCEEL
jgi:hypothetical protein